MQRERSVALRQRTHGLDPYGELSIMSPHRAQRSPSTWRSPLARRARSPCRPLTGQRRPAPTACQHCRRAAPACTWGMPLTLRQRGALTLGLIPGRTHAARPRKFCRCRAECLVGGPHLQRVYAESPIFRSAPAPVCPSPHIAPASRTSGPRSRRGCGVLPMRRQWDVERWRRLPAPRRWSHP